MAQTRDIYQTAVGSASTRGSDPLTAAAFVGGLVGLAGYLAGGYYGYRIKPTWWTPLLGAGIGGTVAAVVTGVAVAGSAGTAGGSE